MMAEVLSLSLAEAVAGWLQIGDVVGGEKVSGDLEGEEGK